MVPAVPGSAAPDPRAGRLSVAAVRVVRAADPREEIGQLSTPGHRFGGGFVARDHPPGMATDPRADHGELVGPLPRGG
jgi:hypothetical protein